MPKSLDEMLDGANAESCMVGSLAAWPLEDILLWLHASRRTAMLRVGKGLDAGVVFFKEGLLYRTEWGSRAGLDALMGLLELSSEPFWLIMRDVPEPHPNIRVPTEELLARCATAGRGRRRG